MALINCPECSKIISDQSTACPSCGHPTPSSVPPPLSQPSYKNNHSLASSPSRHQIEKNNGCSSFIFFILIIASIGYWLSDEDEDESYSKDTVQYSGDQSQPYENRTLTDETAIDPKLIPIPMLLSGSGENGRYFLISQFKSYNLENISYLRTGNAGDTFGKMQIDCIGNKIRKTSTDSPDSLGSADLGDWYTPTPDWTDQDIVNFICK